MSIENAAFIMRKHKFFSVYWGTCLSKNFDVIVPIQSKRRDEWLQEVKAERLQGTADAEAAHLTGQLLDCFINHEK